MARWLACLTENYSTHNPEEFFPNDGSGIKYPMEVDKNLSSNFR